MHPVIHVYLYDEADNRFFGEGPCRLLRGIEETGSLRQASQRMGMAYSKALPMLRRAEEALGFPLTEKTIGGKGGGGSRLTAEAKEFLQRYEAYRAACREADSQLYHQFFPSER